MCSAICLVTLIIPSYWARAEESVLSPEDSIRAVLAAQETAWNKHDLDEFLKGYWNSPDVVFQSGGERFDGFAAMRDRYRKSYLTEGKEMGKLTFSGIEVSMLGRDSAFVRGGWALVKSDGSNPKGLFTLIFRKFPEGWRIVHDHTSIANPPKP